MKKLTRNIFALLLLLCISFPSFAQGGRPPMYKGAGQGKMRRPNVAKRFEAIKKGFISQQLALTTEQGARFWPVYDQYQRELEDIAKLRRANNTTVQPNGADQFDRELSYQQKITGVQKHYYEEFCKILPPDKAGQVFKSERDFKFQLLLRLREGRQAKDN
jgi:Spy/CpxP family protein refolding chaperone